jgi:hypothetical protein
VYFGCGVYDGGMVDTSSLAGVLRASQQPVRRQPRPTPQPVSSAANPINQLMRGTDTNLGYSRANQDLVNRRGGEMFLSPFSTLTDEAKNTGALQRGTPASAALSTAAFLGDVLNPSFGLPIGVGGGQAAAAAAPRIRPAFQTPEVRNAALMRAIMEDPETTVRTVRSMGSAEDIIGGSGRFLSSRQTGTSPASPGGVSNYNPIREVAENATWGPGVDNVQYGYVTSPVLKNQPRPFQIGSGGREALQDYLKIAESMDDYLPALRYGQGQSKIASPVQYVLNPAVARNAQYFPTDSLLSQWKAGLGEGAPRITQSFDEFVRANQGVPNGYVEAAIPNLTINDISKINAMTGPETMRASGLGVKADAQSRMAAINKLLEQSGRDVPVGAITQWNSSFMPAGVSRSSAYQMPPTPRQQTSSALRNLQRRFNDTFVRPPVMPSTGVI